MELPDKNTRRTQSDKIGSEMYGENWDRIIAGINELDPAFATFIREIAYGSVYPRKGLGLREREISAISVLTLLNLKPQLKSHLVAARNVGISKAEIIELILHLSMFIGFPLALNALRLTQEVFSRSEALEKR